MSVLVSTFTQYYLPICGVSSIVCSRGAEPVPVVCIGVHQCIRVIAKLSAAKVERDGGRAGKEGGTIDGLGANQVGKRIPVIRRDP